MKTWIRAVSAVGIAVAVTLVGTPANASGGIAKGTTVRGSAYYQFTSTVPGFFQFGVNLPGRARNALTPADVNFAPDSLAATTDDDPTCMGNYILPTAPPGKVCIYLWPNYPVSANVAGLTAGGDAPVSPEFSRSSFWIAWQTGASESAAVYVYARWAYTAP